MARNLIGFTPRKTLRGQTEQHRSNGSWERRRNSDCSVYPGFRSAVTTGKQGMEFFAFDASYVEKLRAGDAHIEKHFVNYFSELIRLKLRSRLKSKEAMEDVRQETFMRVLTLLRGKSGLREPDRFGPFVNSVCNHVLLEHYRSQKRTEATIDDEVEATIAGREPNALSLLEAKDAERVVRQILNQLPERDRRLLQSVLLEERNKDEVCAEFGITREYLRVLLHRAKQSFKSCYGSRLDVS
jgi:RNA polymerase sigma-70 factor (ECF subfamily)